MYFNNGDFCKISSVKSLLSYNSGMNLNDHLLPMCPL